MLSKGNPFHLFQSGKRVLFILLLILIDKALYPAGFYIPDVGARCLGRGSAFVAKADDLTAIFHNPAGLANLIGTNILLDIGFIDRYAEFDRADEESTSYPAVKAKEIVSPIPFLGVSYDFNSNAFTLGLSLYAPYGAPKVKFPENGPQRYNIVTSSIAQIFYSLAAGARITRWLMFGFNASLVDLFAYQNMKLYTGLNDADVTFKLSARGIPSWSTGAILNVTESLTIGVSYLPPIPANLKGYMKAREIPLLPELSDNLNVNIKLPPILRFGLRYAFDQNKDIEVDIVWTGWSTIKDYTGIFEKKSLFGIERITYPKNWRDSISIRAGGDYNISSRITLRAGYFYDQGAVPEETMDASSFDLDGHGITTGVSMSVDRYTFSLSYAHVFMPDIIVKNSEAGAQIYPPLIPKVIRSNGRYSAGWNIAVLAIQAGF